MMEQIRAFIAVELPPDFKLALARLQDKLKSGGRAPVKWVEPDNIHLTLKFLGNIDAALIDRVTGVMQEAARGVHPFRVEMGGLGVFPGPGRVRIVWVGLTGDVAKLTQLQKGLDAALAPLGFTPESRPFTPHLTLARVRDNASPEQRQDLGRLVTATRFEVPGSIKVDAVHLMRSQLTREGPVYTRLSSLTLA
jgi:2'-5' RNA ligase